MLYRVYHICGVRFAGLPNVRDSWHALKVRMQQKVDIEGAMAYAEKELHLTPIGMPGFLVYIFVLVLFLAFVLKCRLLLLLNLGYRSYLEFG